MLTTLAMGQVEFTFEVDMNGETVSADGVHIAGDWQAANGGAGDWDPSTDEMLDGDGDGIYTLTIDVPEAGYRYKYVNGNAWGGVEDVPAVCEVGNGDDNRYFQLMAAGYDSTGAIVFGASAPDGMTAIKFQVIIPDGADTVAHIAGDAFDPSWTANATPLYDQGNNTYVVSYAVLDGDYSYKFLTGDEWGTDEQSIPDSCSTGGNRTVTIAGADTIIAAVCFNACGPCAAESAITISVDMSLSCIDIGTDVVNLMGTLTDWGDGAAMSDDDLDNIWEITVGAQPGDYEYKFRVGGGTWEGIGNRLLTVVEDVDSIIDVDCWNSTEACSIDAFAPADVTFTVNLADSTLGAGVTAWIMGDFTNWQTDAIQMTDNADGTWSGTVVDFCPQEGRYKFAYGTDPDSSDWVEENADFSDLGGCGEDNPGFSDNRVIVRNSNDATEVCYTFNTCIDCAVGVEEIESLNRVNIYPNPASDVINIVFDRNDEYTVRIMDLSGKLVYSNVVNADRLRIENNRLVSGVYFVRIEDAYNNTITKKLVVK